jgi:NosR/NirI family transcriptional regulator, nitrous oxide reductase regulator
VQAIQPEGNIHPGECIYCLKCQTNYFNELVCPPMIERRKRRERRAAAGRGGSDFLPVTATKKP